MKTGIDYPGITLAFYCHNGAGKFLMNLRGRNSRDEHGRWDIGAGGLEFGYGVEHTLRTEVKEEYGTDVLDYSFLGFRELHRQHEGQPTHWIALDFKVRVDPSKVKNGEPHKFDKVSWFTLESIPKPVHSQFYNFLEKYRALLTDDREKRVELAEILGKAIHERLVGTELLKGSGETTHEFNDENLRHSDVNFAKMSAYDILDMLRRDGYEIIKRP
ncbi:MAG: pyrophosphohydrolase [Candidatus Parcubacteria bacterium]|nr:pyrophosphohydrolase [Candidatus Parcubacteria bacterium]